MTDTLLGMGVPPNPWTVPRLPVDSGAQGTKGNGQTTLTLQRPLFLPCLWLSPSFLPSTAGLPPPILQMEKLRPREGKSTLIGQIWEVADAIPHLQPCQGQSPAPKSTVSPLPTSLEGQWGVGWAGTFSEVVAWPQPFPQPGQLGPCHQATLPCTFLFLNKHSLRVLGHFPST